MFSVHFASYCLASHTSLPVPFRHVSIIASFTIEKQNVQSNVGNIILRGILTNYGYALPDPSKRNRSSIWFTAGTIEPADADKESLKEWKQIFGSQKVSSLQGISNKARYIASKILLGAVSEPMDESGTVGFYLKRPIGGHGYAYCDVVYMDDDIRVMRGHSGSVYVFKRVEIND
jgi:hypothetical protein